MVLDFERKISKVLVDQQAWKRNCFQIAKGKVEAAYQLATTARAENVVQSSDAETMRQWRREEERRG